jgi:hypothetical protein
MSMEAGKRVVDPYGERVSCSTGPARCDPHISAFHPETNGFTRPQA